MQMLPFWFGTMAVGALGGAVGARVNMIRHQSLEHGFFDRKYSLRGLLLPLLAAFAAMILFVPFALLAHFVPVSPLIALSLIGVAAVLAFLFGFFQEALYGTRP
jgi:Na+/H+-translocating membrane pyrophosphatase